MSESGFWRKGVAVALIVLMLFVAAAMLTPVAGAVVAHYTYDPDRHPPSDRLFIDIGETSDPFYVTIGIYWGGEDPRPVETEMNWTCVCDGVDATGSMGFDFQPSTFTLNSDNLYSQIVTVRVTSLGGAPEPRVSCKVQAWELNPPSPPDTPMGQGPGCQVYLETTVGPPPNGNGCFIATASYGTSTAAEIDTLRAFRDEVLLQNSLGSQLVAIYYEVSPPVADFISEHEGLRTLVRELLVDPVAWLVEATEAIWGD
ncbi:hypothetical protein ES703_100365 [subsurface metagenome]